MAVALGTAAKKLRLGSSAPSRMYAGSTAFWDADAAAYVAAVEAADEQPLELGVVAAYHSFVLGCKANGIWDAIKASCILCGARTLAGALVPLKGAAPTNNNFVSGDYNRAVGLEGNGSTKYLNTNRASSADPQNNHHMGIYQTVFANGTAGSLEGTYTANQASFDRVVSAFVSSAQTIFCNSRSGNAGGLSHTAVPGFLGHTRISGSSYSVRRNGATVAGSSSGNTSYTPNADNIYAFARNPGNNGTPSIYAVGTMAFYSIGEALDLALLDTRVSALVTAIGAAI